MVILLQNVFLPDKKINQTQKRIARFAAPKTFQHEKHCMTKHYGLIGKSLDHSLSAAHFNTKFKNMGIDAVYSLYPISSIDDLPALIAENQHLTGLNITIPYKQQVWRYLNEVDFVANMIGAVNTVTIRRDTNGIPYLKGYNTDALGFEQSLKEVLKCRKCGIKALVLGTGGAAKAVKYVLRRLCIPYLSVDRSRIKSDQITYNFVNPYTIEEYKLIINTTPLGMYPLFVGQAPELPYDRLTSDHILYDLVYNPEDTAFLQHGINHGSTIITGKKMFLYQAENAWKIWQKHQT